MVLLNLRNLWIRIALTLTCELLVWRSYDEVFNGEKSLTGLADVRCAQRGVAGLRAKRLEVFPIRLVAG